MYFGWRISPPRELIQPRLHLRFNFVVALVGTGLWILAFNSANVQIVAVFVQAWICFWGHTVSPSTCKCAAWFASSNLTPPMPTLRFGLASKESVMPALVCSGFRHRGSEFLRHRNKSR
jgi:hypothetical protein